MTTVLVTGQPRAGKTLFVIQFAAFLNVSELRLHVTAPGEPTHVVTLPVSRARAELVDGADHKTRALQAVDVQVPVRKHVRVIRLTDTTGLSDDIHQDAPVREAMAQTLRALRSAEAALHLIDAHRAGEDPRAIADVDREIVRFMASRGPFAVVASKMDLPGASTGLERIRRAFPEARVIPVSSVTRAGFPEVRRFFAGRW
ncbi:MAG: GTPase domain-containing protein [Clostridia bacterium]|nr:GTPase domain-containing protein [Clostridia bacterium]